MKDTQPPCGGCQERHPGCHAECEKYKAFAEERHKARDETYRQKKIEHEAQRFMFANRTKAIRKMGARKKKKYKL